MNNGITRTEMVAMPDGSVATGTAFLRPGRYKWFLSQGWVRMVHRERHEPTPVPEVASKKKK